MFAKPPATAHQPTESTPRFFPPKKFTYVSLRWFYHHQKQSSLNVFKLAKVSKVGQGDSNFSSQQQIVQNLKLEIPTSDGQWTECIIYSQRFLQQIMRVQNDMTALYFGQVLLINWWLANIPNSSFTQVNGWYNVGIFCPSTDDMMLKNIILYRMIYCWQHLSFVHVKMI